MTGFGTLLSSYITRGIGVVIRLCGQGSHAHIYKFSMFDQDLERLSMYT